MATALTATALTATPPWRDARLAPIIAKCRELIEKTGCKLLALFRDGASAFVMITDFHLGMAVNRGFEGRYSDLKANIIDLLCPEGDKPAYPPGWCALIPCVTPPRGQLMHAVEKFQQRWRTLAGMCSNYFQDGGLGLVVAQLGHSPLTVASPHAEASWRASMLWRLTQPVLEPTQIALPPAAGALGDSACML